MINIFPPLLYMLTLYGVYRYIGRFYCLSVFIWLMHAVSMLCFWIKADFFTPFKNDYTIEALAVMFFTLLFITMPLIKYEKSVAKKNDLKLVNEVRLKNVSFFLVIIGIYAVGFFVVNLPKVFAMNIVDFRDERMVFYESTIFSKVAILGAFCSVFSIYFYFYYLVLKTNKLLRFLLLFSSTSFIIYTLNVAGRDGIIIWALSFLAGMFLFHKYFERKQLKKIWKVFAIASVFVMPIMVFITNSRFSDGGEENSAFDSVLSYAGQSLPNLSYKIELTNQINRRSGDGVFPIAIVRTLLGQETDRFQRMENSAVFGFRSNQFSSYVSFFYPSYPIYFLILFIILFCIIIASSTKNKHGFDPVGFLPAYTWSMIPIVGIFYFYYGELIGNVFLILPFIIKAYLAVPASGTTNRYSIK